MKLTLDRTQRRVLGVLMEKAMTTPDQYPLTVKALHAGCEQKSNRHPQMTFQEFEIEGTLRALLLDDWVMEVRRSGSRTSRYEERMARRMDWSRRQAAVMAELLLRGPATAAEIRSRASRMAEFDAEEGVEGILEAWAEGAHPLVERLPKRPGERGERWFHTLTPDEEEPLEPEGTSSAGPIASPTAIDLQQRVEELEGEVARLATVVRRVVAELGLEEESD